MKHEELTGKIIQAFYEVYNTLGWGFLEKTYEKAMIEELGRLGVRVSSQAPISVVYKGANVGEYFADLLVEKSVICELKAAESISQAHVAQLTNYLKASEIEIGLVLNFGRKAEVKRVIYDL